MIERKIVHHSAASATATGTVLNCTCLAGILVQISGTFVATVTFQGTIDASNWVAIQATNGNSGAVATTATAAGLYYVPCSGLRLFRANLAWTSGTSITVISIGVDATPGFVADLDVQFLDENGTPYGIKHVDNKPRVSAMPYLFDIAEGLVADHELFGAFGERQAVAVVATGADVWGGTANAIPRPADAGEQLEIVSTSANDDGAPVGTGIRTVGVHYLDADGAEQDETVTLNGTTPVALTETNVRFVNDLHAATVGSTGAAVGAITLYKQGAAATVYSQITAGSTMQLSTQKMVPAGKTMYLTQWTATSTSGKAIALRLRITQRHNVLFPGVFLVFDGATLQDAPYVQCFTSPIQIPPLAVIKVSAYAIQAAGNVSAGWRGWKES